MRFYVAGCTPGDLIFILLEVYPQTKPLQSYGAQEKARARGGVYFRADGALLRDGSRATVPRTLSTLI